MHLFFLLPLLLRFANAISSIDSPNISIADSSLSESTEHEVFKRYQIFPRDATNATEAEEIDRYLRARYGDANTTHWFEDSDRRWLVHAKREDVRDLRAHSSIRAVSRTLATFPPKHGKHELERRDEVTSNRFIAAAKDPKDDDGSTNITDHILGLVPDKSRVTLLRSIDGTNKIEAWGALNITQEQADDLAKRDEIANVTKAEVPTKRLSIGNMLRDVLAQVDDNADSNISKLRSPTSLFKRTAPVWKKQEGAFNHLVSVSQYP